MRGIVAPVLVNERDLSIIPPDMELALMFALMEYDKRRHEQYRDASYEFFSKIVWSLILIQAGSENYIGIDGSSIFDLDFKKTKFLEPDSPVFSMLRHDLNDYQALLDIFTWILDELKAPLKENLRIKGILNPEILHGFVPLIKLATDKSLTSARMISDISTDNLIETTNQYNQALKVIEETISKWHRLQQNLEQKYEKWQSSYATPPSPLERDKLGNIFEDLNKKILDRIWDCRNEIDYLLHWALPGRSLNLVIPITEIWIPLYLAGINLPNQNKRKFLLLPPSVFSEEIKSNRWVPVDSFHSSFNSVFKEKIESALDSQSQLTHKITAICQTQNLFLLEDANKLITRGFHRLREKKIIDDKQIENLQQQWQTTAQILKK